MADNPILFKLTKPPNGLTRRVLFHQRPSWSDLASKIHSLYAIPVTNVGVSYPDSDGDEVTLSSEEELQDFYRFSDHSPSMFPRDDPNKAIKFTVRHIPAARNWDPPVSHPDSPRSSTHRNTFGTFPNMIFDVGDGWHRVPSGDFLMAVGSNGANSPHAFVEVLDSDASFTKGDDKGNKPIDTQFTTRNTVDKTDKGKGKARAEDSTSTDGADDDASSTVSMLAESTPSKPPIHAIGVAHTAVGTTTTARNTTLPTSRPISRALSHRSTPKPPFPDPVNAAAPDPPLADLPSDQHANASLATDVANLFNALSIVFASHPELSDGLRNIVHGATSGTYWSSHRRAVALAAEEIRRSFHGGTDDLRRAAEEAHRAAEETAGRRVTEAIGNVVRVLSGITGGAQGTTPVDAMTSTPVATRIAPATASTRPHPPAPFHPDIRASHESREHARDVEYGQRQHLSDERFYQGLGLRHRRESYPPVAPPPPAVPPPPVLNPTGAFHIRPPIPPPLGHHIHANTYNPAPSLSFSQQDPQPSLPPRTREWEHSHLGHPSDRPFIDRPGSVRISRSVSQETRERLEAAKEAYKAEKERYRKEREEKKKEKKTSDMRPPPEERSRARAPFNKPAFTVPLAGPPAREISGGYFNEPVVQLVSNARGPYPQLEMIDVTPRRYDTTQGNVRSHRAVESDIPGPSRNLGGRDGSIYESTRVTHSVERRLEDMGFTASTHPNLSNRVASRVSQVINKSQGDDEVSHVTEDEIVSDVLEDLLDVDKDLPPRPSLSARPSVEHEQMGGTVKP